MIKTLRKQLNQNKGMTSAVFGAFFYAIMIIQYGATQKVHVRRYLEVGFINQILSAVYNFVLSTLYLMPAMIISSVLAALTMLVYLKTKKK